ncbi:MAG TPA: DMT family transporter [Sulfuricurvum sp.]|nr:DMT family transporter [Sulfuricurvum sp.]
MLLSAFISALNGAVAKVLGEELSALEIVFYRNLIGVVIVLAMLRHTPPSLPGGNPHLLVLRGLFGFSAMILFFYTITVIPLGEAITLNKTSPLFVSVLAFFLLKERLGRYAVAALLIGFSGVVLISKPTGMLMGYEHFLGLLGGFFAAAAYATIKTIRHIYDTRVIVLSFMGIGTLAPLLLFCIAPFITPPDALQFLFPDFVLPVSLNVWALIAFMALISTLSQWLLTKAYSFSRAGVIGAVSYTNIPFAVGFGVMLGDALPGPYVWLGIIMIIMAGLLVKKE